MACSCSTLRSLLNPLGQSRDSGVLFCEFNLEKKVQDNNITMLSTELSIIVIQPILTGDLTLRNVSDTPGLR